jgi:hypothetical protein
MNNQPKTNASDLEVLEAYFKKYPDVPKETILTASLSPGHGSAMPRSSVGRRASQIV